MGGVNMHSFELAGMRHRLDEGEALDAADQRRLVDAVHELISAARLPSEFLVRVHRDAEATGWTAEHPLFLTSASSRHPADALVLAGLELRRVLERDVPEFTDDEPEELRFFRRRPLAEDVWDTLTRTEPGPDTVVALAAALSALEKARREANELRYGETIRRVIRDLDARPEEREAARAEVRHRHAARLAAAGVEGADVPWKEDAFGPADAFGIDLPVLVVGFKTSAGWPQEWDEGRRTDTGHWIALEHQWDNDDLWSGDPKSVRLVAQPLRPTPEAELALRRLTEAAPSGESVRDHVAYHRAVAEHVPGVSVERVRGWVSPAALPIDVESLDRLVADPPDLTGATPLFWDAHLYWLSHLPGGRR
jgi:hypothetical protein